MCRITEIPVEDIRLWNDTVRSFLDYDVFYLNEYVTAFMQEHKENGVPILLRYDNGAERGIYVVFKRDIAHDTRFEGKLTEGTYFDLISPYGYGGFWGSICDYDALNKAFNAHCASHGYICEFLRFHLFSDYHRFYDGEVETRSHNVVRSLDLPMEDIWMDFKQKVRKNVKRANEHGLQIAIENTGEYLTEFLNIYYATMDRSSAEQSYYFSKEFFEKLNYMKDNIMYFHVLYGGNVISSELVLFGKKNAYSYLGGTYSDYFNLRPNDFLKYEIIKWAKKQGLNYFVLGGGYGSDDGIFQYKSCIAPHGVVDFFIGHKIFDHEVYEQLLAMRAVDEPECVSSDFFPQYRA